MVRKPRRVKKSGVRRSYLVSAVVVVLLIGLGAWYFMGSPGLPTYAVNANSTSGTSVSSSGQTSTSSTGSTTSMAGSTLSGCPSPPASMASNLVYARINTTFGSVEVELFPTGAPKSVANFVNLSKTGFYNNLVWHRIVAGFVIQTGDPLTRNSGGDRSLWGTGGSGKTVPLETNPALHNYICYLGMARGQDVNSGTSQFYINLGNNTSLDGSYTVFGRVVSGMNIVNQIAAVPVNSASQPVNPVFMTSVTILSNGP